MNHVYTERALRHMDWEIRQAEIDAYKSDYLHDRIFLVKHEPKVFVWVIRDSGTHIYSLDDPSVTEGGAEKYHTHIRLVATILDSHKKNDNIVGVFAFYEGYSARISIDDAILLAESYLPAGAATRVVRNND